MSIPRQTGKTFLVSLLAIHRAASVPGLRAVWTAQHFSVIRDTFEAMAGLCAIPRMAGLVDPVRGIRRGTGSEAIVFRNGSRIMFRARERGAIRGFRNVGLLVADEAQIMSDGAMASMVPTQNRATNPQALFMGTPPGPLDPGEVFERMRGRALTGQSKKTLWVEFAADKDMDPASEEAWAKANPSFPERTKRDAMTQMLDDLSPDDFRREALGIWSESRARSAIDQSLWKQGEVSRRRPGGVKSFAVDMTPDRRTLTIGACMRYADGSAHIEMAARQPTTRGVDWAVDWISSRWPSAASVVVDAGSPASVIIPSLEQAGVRVTTAGARQEADACGRLLDMLRQGTLRHLPDAMQPQLADAVAHAITRPIGRQGLVAFSRPGTDIDISPLVACALALEGAMTARRNPTGPPQQLIF